MNEGNSCVYQTNFVHLHVHTEYSLLDGAGRINDVVRTAKELGMDSIAITDHGVMYGVIDFYKAARKQGVKPILGCEVYVAPRTRHDRTPRVDDSPYHLVLLAENLTGYRNLMQLVSLGYTEGFYYRPRIDRELLVRYHEGLIALSGCLAGEIAQLLLKGQYLQAQEAAAFYRELFGKDNFFLEIQDHGIAEQKVLNPRLIELSRATGIPLVATNDAHYVRSTDAYIHDVLLCIQTGKTIDDPNRLKFGTEEFYLKSGEEMAALFAHLPEALANTVRIAERCEVELDFQKIYLPSFEVPGGGDADTYLAKLCEEGLQRRYPKITPAIRKRLDYELGVIKQMGFATYFLIVWDFITYARSRGILVGPGRGSVAGSLVAYVLGITDLDPLRYGLLFERFLNPERVTMPDIDVDFCFERRGEVIDYIIEKYGNDKVAQIITFGTMAARAAIRDVGRALNLPYAQVDKIAKLLPFELGMTIEKALQTVPELRELYENSEEVRNLLDTAQAVEGLPRHASTHAAGVVISKDPLTNHVPLQKTGDGILTTQFAKETVEEIGLLKMDFLGLRTLTVLNETEKIIQDTGQKFALNSIPLDDPKTYAMLSEGETTGVFQLESAGMRNLIKELKPNSFEDLIPLLALYRPGPLGSGMVEDFIQARHGKKPVTYLHPSLEPILKDTYGMILYQEQVMQIASTLAGFSLGQADLLRRAMGKKKHDVLAAQRQSFLEGAARNGVERELAENIFDLMAHFADYGFNKSHSAVYALIAYQTAYLKANYPVPYMAALLTSVMDNTDKVAFYIDECRRLGIKILPPDINESLTNFTVVGDGIRFGLAAVKNVGVNAIEQIIGAREREGKFISFRHFCESVDLRVVNKRVMESLIKSGAFASLGLNRAQLLNILDHTVECAQRKQKAKDDHQMSLFDFVLPQPDDEKEEIPELPEFPQSKVLAMEKETLGFYISGHPLADVQDQLKQHTTTAISRLSERKDGEAVIIGGMIVEFKRITTRHGQLMVFAQCEDMAGSVEIVIFPRVYEQYRHLIKEEGVVLIEGKVNRQEEGVKVIAETIRPLGGRIQNVYIRLMGREEDQEIIEELKRTCLAYHGSNPVYFCGKQKTVLANKQLWVEVNSDFIAAMEKLLGEGAVSISAS